MHDIKYFLIPRPVYATAFKLEPISGNLKPNQGHLNSHSNFCETGRGRSASHLPAPARPLHGHQPLQPRQAARTPPPGRLGLVCKI